MTAPAAPLAPRDRLALVDVLRGFCVLAILLVNFIGDTETTFPKADEAVAWWLDTLVSNSIYPLFAFLFGFGFAMQLERAPAGDAAVMLLYLRRMLGLVLIGLFHMVVIWRGDILLNYALMGFILIPFRWVPTRALLVVIVLLLARHVSNLSLDDTVRSWTSASVADERNATLAQEIRNDHGRQINYRRMRADAEPGTWRGGLADRSYEAAVNLRDATTGVTGLLDEFSSNIFIMFLLGLYGGRRRWLQDAGNRRKQFAIAGGIALLLVVAGNISFYQEPANAALQRFLGFWAANVALAAVYLCVFALLVPRGGKVAERLAILAPVGRMALTNYITQSVVMTWLFEPWGVGLDEPGTTAWLLLNLAFFFAVQVPWSHWWLKRFRYGPLEWAWRSMTYGAWQPIRRDAATLQPLAT